MQCSAGVDAEAEREAEAGAARLIKMLIKQHRFDAKKHDHNK